MSTPAATIAHDGPSLRFGMVTATFSGMTISSWQYHATETDAWKYRDHAMISNSIASTAASAWQPTLGKSVWALYVPISLHYLLNDQKRRLGLEYPMLHGVFWAGVATAGIAYNQSLQKAALSLGSLATAVAFRLLTDTGKDLLHTIWHILSASAATISIQMSL